VPSGLPRIGRATLVVIVLALTITVALTFAAQRAHDANEERLLQQQAEEATAVLQASIPGVVATVHEIARVVELVDGDPVRIAEELASDLEAEGAAEASQDQFAAIAVLEAPTGDELVHLGDEALRLPQDRIDALIDAASEDVHVTAVLDGPNRRIVYSREVSGTDLVVVGKRILRGPRITGERTGEAFNAVDLAIYLGDDEDDADLITSTTPDLPIDGRRATRTLPFGDNQLLFVVSPAGNLGGGLLAVLPWFTAVAGLILGTIAAVLVESVHRRRLDAEAFGEELHALYQREHAIAHTLQHSLLPTHLDRLEDIEVAARYFAGAEGTDIGGDWYDVINDGDGTFTVVVGDVVGRGVKAAAVMAAMRYATHAVAGQSTDPAEILGAVNKLEHIRGDFVTMLCGNVDPVARTICFASAGHPAPLLISPDETRFLRVSPGPPIGFLDEPTFPVKRTTIPHGSVVVLFTDGLYERRGESIEVGLERLRDAASRLDGSVDDILDGLAAAMLGNGVRDDTAMLAFRV